jgi:Rap1a immunity proteins
MAIHSTHTRIKLLKSMNQVSSQVLKASFALACALVIYPSDLNAAVEDNYTITDGNALLTVCSDAVAALDRGGRANERDVLSLVVCTSYLRGFTHGVALLSNEPEQGFGYCIPESVPASQTVRVVVKYLREVPALLHLHPAVLVSRALKYGFPCRAR